MFKKSETARKIFYKQDGEEVYVDMMQQFVDFNKGVVK